MSIYINKDTKVITQGITGKTGQFHTLGCQAYANGRAAFVAGIRALMDKPSLLSKHQGHHPEIELLAPDRAKGTWYLEDQVIDLDGSWLVHGTAFYQDEYIKRDGVWQILATGYRRVFETLTAPIPETLRLTASWFE